LNVMTQAGDVSLSSAWSCRLSSEEVLGFAISCDFALYANKQRRLDTIVAFYSKAT